MSRKPPVAGRRHVKSAPRFGEVYWVDLPSDFIKPPEFGPPHPGVVIRPARRLSDAVMIVPITSTHQDTSQKYSYELTEDPNPLKDKHRQWAVCNHIYTVATERLRPFKDRFGNDVIVKMCAEDLRQVSKLVQEALDRTRQVAALPPPLPPTMTSVRPKGPNTLSLKPKAAESSDPGEAKG